MKITLIFPPGWDPIQPYLSLPALKAYLERSSHKVSLYDLNVEFYDQMASPLSLENAYSILENQRATDNTERVENHQHLLLSIRAPLLEAVGVAKAVLRSDDFFSESKRGRALRIIDLALQVQSAAYQKMDVSLQRLEINDNKIDDRSLQQILEDERISPFAQWYRQAFIPILQEQQPQAVGISLVNYDQLIPALILAQEIKRRLPLVPIVFGGDVATRLAGQLVSHPLLSNFIDFVICGEGEVALDALLHHLENNGDDDKLVKLPNLCFKNGNEERRTDACHPLRVETLPPPDFSGLPFEKYFAPRLVLPIESCRGCYWGKCTFCEEVGKPYRTKTAEKVAGEVEFLARRFRTQFFAFTDPATSPKFVRAFSAQLQERKLYVLWRALVRAEYAFDTETDSSAYAGGCRMVMVGVESAVPRIQDLVKKGITTGQATKALQNFHKQGIWTHCFLMMGIPTETFAEVLETLDFLNRNGTFIDSVGLSEFAACSGTPILQQLHEFQVQIEEGSDNPWKLHFTRLKGAILDESDKVRGLAAYGDTLSSFLTDVDAWLQLHVNHLFLQIAVMGRESLIRKRTRTAVAARDHRTDLSMTV